MTSMIVLANEYESGGRANILDKFSGDIYEDMLECGGVKSKTPVEGYFDELKTISEKLRIGPLPGDESIEGKLNGGMDGVEEVEDVDLERSLVVWSDHTAQQFRNIYCSFGWLGVIMIKTGRWRRLEHMHGAGVMRC